jgi:hypothetical protein
MEVPPELIDEGFAVIATEAAGNIAAIFPPPHPVKRAVTRQMQMKPKDALLLNPELRVVRTGLSLVVFEHKSVQCQPHSLCMNG